jgi:hypothetical protein
LEIPKGRGAKHQAEGVLEDLPEFELGAYRHHEAVALAATSWTSWHAWKARPSAMWPSGSRIGSAPPATHSDAMKAVLATGAHLLPFNQN